MLTNNTSPPEDPLVQHIVVRSDLRTSLGWTLGSVIAQACHASIAAIFAHRDDPSVVEYLAALERMHKVVVEVCE